jgi:Fe-S cluster assembly protein SufD
MSAPVGADAFVAQFEARRAELPGLGPERERALASFVEAGLPTQRDEDWRFTSLASFAVLPFESAAQVSGPPPPPDPSEGHVIAFANGVFSPEHSRLDDLPAGVRVEPLSSVLEDRPDQVAARIGQLADDKARAFTALNSALFEDGAWIEIDAAQSLDQPIEILDLGGACDRPAARHLRHLISAGAGSRAVVIEHTRGAGDGPVFVNPVSEIWLARDARLDHVLLQQETPEAYVLRAVSAQLEAGSHFASHSLALGGELARVDLHCTLAGEGAHARLLGLYLGGGRQLLDHHTTIDHATPHTTSDELYKGVLADRARGVFHGRIHVRPHAQKISALQQNRNLLLSDRASVNTKPQLEIFADDVRCSHGATIGQLDSDQLFYLRTRGLGADAARALLTLAFASEVVRELPLDKLASQLQDYLLAWLPRGEAA